MVSWPASLPQTSLIDGYQETHIDGVVRSETDIGPPKQRQRFTGIMEDVVWVFLMTEAQIDILEDFFFNTLAHGSVSFDHVNPRTGDAETYQFRAPLAYAPVSHELTRVTIQLKQVP